jgi:hypothetical protein
LKLLLKFLEFQAISLCYLLIQEKSMDVSGISTNAMVNNVGGSKDGVGIAMLKKSMDMQQQSASQLINSIPEAPKATSSENLPLTLGQSLNEAV